MKRIDVSIWRKSLMSVREEKVTVALGAQRKEI